MRKKVGHNLKLPTIAPGPDHLLEKKNEMSRNNFLIACLLLMSMYNTLGSSSLFQMTDCVPERQSFGGTPQTIGSGYDWGLSGLRLHYGDIWDDLNVGGVCLSFDQEHPNQPGGKYIYFTSFAVFAPEHLLATSSELNNNPPVLSTFTFHVNVVYPNRTFQSYDGDSTSCLRSVGFDRLDLPERMQDDETKLYGYVSFHTQGATRVAENFTSGVHCQACVSDKDCAYWTYFNNRYVFLNGTCSIPGGYTPNLCIPRDAPQTWPPTCAPTAIAPSPTADSGSGSSQSDDSSPSIWSNHTFILVLVCGIIASLTAVALFARMFCCPPNNTPAASIPMYQQLQGRPPRAKQGNGIFSGITDQTEVLID